MEMAAKAASPAAADQDFAAEGFFEYHLYTLDGRTTIKDNQTKQLTLMSASGRAGGQAAHLLRRRRSTTATPTACRCRTRRSASTWSSRTARRTGSACRCPRARCASTRPTRSGSQQFIGEDWIDHTPKDEKVRIKMGDAFDVVAERIQKDWKKDRRQPLRDRVGDLAAQPQGEAVDRAVIEPVPGDWQVLRPPTCTRRSRPHRPVEVPVPKEGAAKLTYRTRVRF